jgi:mannan endo-1,4-beta-mannosidase
MSRHIKSVDSHHLASVGDEGFFCDDPAQTDWTRNCGEGVDTLAFTRLPAIDTMSFHLYPQSWGKDLAWSNDWVVRHAKEAKKIGKPVTFGEFGWADKSTRNPVYQGWTDLYDKAGGTGWLYWILSGIQDDGTLYPDFDGYTVYCPSPVCTTLSNAGEELTGPQRSRPPVADNDVALTEFNTAATLNVAANDIAYRTKVKPATIDLDPATAGQQQAFSAPGGAFALAADGTVGFTPETGFAGKVVAHYTIRDLAGHTSNVADIAVTVKPDPNGAIPIATFETGTEGWHSVNGLAIGVTTTTDYATQGTHSLEVDTNGTGGDWIGLNLPEPLNLSGKTMFKYDLRTIEAGTSLTASVQVGSSFEWCQWPFAEFLGGGSTRTVELDLVNGTSCADLSSRLGDVKAVWIWVAGGGHFDIDNVRVE